MKICCLIQARSTSKRLPGKILKIINNKTIIEHLDERIRKIKNIEDIIYLIPNNKKNNNLKLFLKKKKFLFHQGSEKNVLKRYYDAAKKNNIDIIMRITSDCPLLDPNLCSQMLNSFLKNKIDYISNILIRSFPKGLDCEIFNFKTLEKTFKLAKSKYDKEHVTPYIKKSNRFKKKNFINKDGFYNDQRWTLDYKEDLKMIKLVLSNNKLKKNFNWKKIYKFYKNKFNDKPYYNQKYIDAN